MSTLSDTDPAGTALARSSYARRAVNAIRSAVSGSWRIGAEVVAGLVVFLAVFYLAHMFQHARASNRDVRQPCCADRHDLPAPAR